MTAGATVTLTFVDPRHRGAILITKTRKHVADGTGDHPHVGVDFTVNGVTKATGLDGKVCVDNPLFASYTVAETVPAGYLGEPDKTVTVDNRASCADATYVGETVSFSNMPLSGITVAFNSLITGGTAAQISCAGLTATTPDATPLAFDDTSETFTNTARHLHLCTVVVDP